ncbi:MAG: DUF2135 domain-containing protein, partial [Kiritimatiellae bacterium]|nr:DUF2135 domain-containing protein [Kiritimatiellia bacterium]
TPSEAEEAAIYDAAPAPVGQPEITVGSRNAAPQVNVKRKRITATGPQRSPAPTVTLKPWNPDTPYLKALEAAPKDDAYAVCLKERKTYADAPAFYLDCADWFFKHTENTELAERIISNLAEFKLDDAALWRTMGWRLREAKRYALAIHCFRKVLALRGEEGQSYSDLALILAEAGKDAVAQHHFESAKPLLEEALTLFTKAIFAPHARRSGRQGNDLQSAVIALEELNGLISWIEAQAWPQQQAPTIPAFDAAYRRDLPLDLRIVMRWDADQTDIDLHVLEPDGEEAYYGHRRTSTGGFVSEDVTTGYGPEEYLRKEALPGTYQLLTNYFASRQTALTGATTVSVTVYTHWATAAETQQILTLRLDKPKERYHIGNAHFQPVTP